jgi:hypothetical protein
MKYFVAVQVEGYVEAESGYEAQVLAEATLRTFDADAPAYEITSTEVNECYPIAKMGPVEAAARGLG